MLTGNLLDLALGPILGDRDLVGQGAPEYLVCWFGEVAKQGAEIWGRSSFIAVGGWSRRWVVFQPPCFFALSDHTVHAAPVPSP